MPPQGGTRTSMKDQAAEYARGLTVFQPGQGIFSPGLPMTPPDPQPVRAFDFPVGLNTTWTPRAYEPFGFPQLRAFANVEPVRLAIETRKDQIERLKWQIKPVDGKRPKGATEAKIAAVTKFLRKPDGVNPFATWLRLSIEDLMVLDAPAWERRRNVRGDLIGLDVVPGDTIKPLVDSNGRRPTGPGVPAYQQVIKGRIWCDLTNDELLYAPRNPRPNHQFGLSPVEQIIVTIMTVMKRQASQLAYFTEGNIPAGILNAAEGWSPDQLKQMQDWLDARLSGNTAERSKLIWVPSGSKYQGLKDSPLKDDFDEWLYRVVAFAFSLPPTPFVRQMNKGTAGEDQERGLEEGVEPIKVWVKRVLDGVIQDDMGEEDLEFGWNDVIDVAPDKQAKIDDENLRNGSTTIDEVRDRRGQEPLPDGLGEKPMVYTATGPVLLEQVHKAAEKAIQDLENPPEPAPQQAPQQAGQGQGGQGEHTGERGDAAPGEQAPKVLARLAKGAAIRPDPALAKKVKAALRRTVLKVFRAAAPAAAKQARAALQKLGKAADDAGDLATYAAAAKKLADALDLSEFDGLAEAIYDELLRMALDGAERGIATLGVKDISELVNQVHKRAVAWAEKHAAELVSGITDTTRDRIATIIAKGLEDNIGADAIADEIEASTAFSPERAELIADTEVATANAEGKLDGWREAQDMGLTITKEWLLGAEACDECQENADAGAIPLDEDFPSGDDAEPAHPNCQCVVVASAEEADSNDAVGGEEE